MSISYIINQQVRTTRFDCKINLEIQYYSNQTGIIKGIKKLKHNTFIYLIEFLNYNRIWIMTQELQSYYSY